MLKNAKLIQTVYHFLFGFPPDQSEDLPSGATESFDLNFNSTNSFAAKNSNFGLDLSRMNFASKLRKASHAINNPYQP
jgi:hypothetical protein